MKDWIKQNKVTEVECIVPDLAGAARGKIVPAAKFLQSNESKLPQSIFMQGITGDYPEEIFDEINPTDADLLLRPDPSTIRMVPWVKEDPVAQVIHDCYDKQGNAIAMAPRQVLKKVIQLYADQGWKPVVAPELEFYLIQPNPNPDEPIEPPVGRNGRIEGAGQAYSIDAVNEFDPVFEDIYDYCEAQEIAIDAVIHEDGTAQMEINLMHGDPLALADQAFLFKRTVREAALRHDMYATFMAKPMQDQPGSAMHIHQSIESLETGENLFSTPDGDPNELLLSHIAGLQTYLPDAIALMLPYVNSYRRIVRDMAAPINFHWGYDNRTVGLRVPDNDPRSMRVENRIASADVNPYIAIATSLACGYIGMMGHLRPSDPISSDAYNLPRQLSRHWYNSLHRLRDNQALREVLGELFIDVYVNVKEVEFDNFLNVISSWEREHLLLKV
jgi:glutamine synthetase